MRMNMSEVEGKVKPDTEYKTLKLGGAQSYDCPSDQAAIVA
jgi:hypothetical protein